MAEVYEGHDERLGRPVAIKLLRADMASHPEVRGRFEVEARAAARLSHPNVVAVFDTGEDAGTPFIVMERLPGETMADRMAAGPVDEEWVKKVAGDVLGALDAAHAAGIVHRDIKPGNILLGTDGCAKVADFGIAKSAEAAAGDPTAVGLLLGTPAYLAPERLDGEPATPRSDLFAVGVVLFEALAGTKPFGGTTPVAMATAIQTEAPLPLAQIRPDVDPVLAGVVAAALAKNPNDRPDSARDMAARLRAGPVPVLASAGEVVDATVADDHLLTAAVPLASTAPVVSGPRRPSRPRRRPSTAWALAGAALVVVLLVTAALANGRKDPAVAGDRPEVSALDDLADRVETGDGLQGPEAATRLRDIAEEIGAGNTDAATVAAQALLADAVTWRQRGDLFETATDEIVGLLDGLAGVDAASVVATTTIAPAPTTAATTAPPPVVDRESDGEGDDGRGKGKAKRERGDD